MLKTEITESTKILLRNNGVNDVDQFINVVFDKLKDLDGNSELHKKISSLEDEIIELKDRLDNASLDI